MITAAEAKALGTIDQGGAVNVVPISMVKADPDAIYIFNFFMEKTLENIKHNQNISFTCWTGMSGVQIKGEVEYITEGELFTELVAWVKTQNPDRVVLGVLKITPQEIFDISPTKDISPADLLLTKPPQPADQ